MKERIRAFVAGDPFRRLMMAVPQGWGVWGLCAGLCGAFALAAVLMLGNMAGAPVVALVGTAALAILLWGMGGALARERQNALVWLVLCGLCMLAVAAHLAMLTIKPGRYTRVLAPLLADMWNYDLATAFSWMEGGWSGVYLIVSGLLSRLTAFSQLYAVKLVDLLCQCMCGAAAVRLVQRRGGGAVAGAAAMLACVLAPTMLMNAGCWAQCDATFAMFTLWGLYLLLSGHPLAGCVLWGIALGTKLQSAFLFPLLIVLFMNRRVSLRHLLALCAAAVLCQAAILLDGQGMMALLGRYAAQLEAARDSIGLSDNAPGVYALMTVASVREFSGMGLYLGIAAALLVVAALLRARQTPDDRTLLLAALLLAAGLPLILPQMNARSLYLAGMLAFCCVDSARSLAVAIALEVVSLCCYMSSIFGLTLVPLSVLSLVAIAAATVIALALVGRIAPRAGEETA